MKNLCLISLVLSSLLLTACGKNNDTDYDYSDQTPVMTEEVTEYKYSASSIDRSSGESVAKGFMEAIKNSDFKTARNLINLEDGYLLTEEDVEYVIRRTLIGYMIGQPDITVYGEQYSELSGTASYGFYTDPNYNYNYYYGMKLSLNESNAWGLDKIGFVKDETLCYVPEGVRLYLDDEEVPTSYKVKTENNTDVYRLTELARKEHKTRIVSSTFGEIDGVLTVPSYDINNPSADNNAIPIEVDREITPELFKELGVIVQDMYNNIYLMMDIEDSAENLNQYITSSKNYKFLEEKYQAGINARLSVNGENGHSKSQVEVLEFWQNPAVSSYVYSNDTIVLNMVLHIRWLENGVARSEKICSGTKLTKEPGGEWLINDITAGAWRTLDSGLDESQGVDAW